MSDPVQVGTTSMPLSDRECLEAWRRQPAAESLRPLIERYLAFVYSSAFRRIGNAAQAAEVTRAVFLVLARRARKLRNKTVLAGWLYDVTAVACRKLVPKRSGWRHAFGRALMKPFIWRRRLRRRDGDIAPCLAGELDPTLDRLPPRQRNAVLLRTLLNYDWPDVAKILRVRETRARKRVARGLKKLTRRLQKRGVMLDGHTVEVPGASRGCTVPEGASEARGVDLLMSVATSLAKPVPEGLGNEVLTAIQGTLEKKPSFNLARQTLNVLARRRWRKRFVLGVPCAFAFLATFGSIAWYIDSLSGHSRLITEYWLWMVRHEAKKVPGLAQPARPWPTEATSSRLSAAAVRSAQDLYQTTNIWLVRLKFSRDQWKALEPTRIEPLPNFFQTNGTILLRNPKAQRRGLAGVIGFDFNWAHADFEIGGKQFTNVASRFKGNGTYVDSLY